MSAKERNDLRDILRAYDNAVTDFDSDHTVVYSSEADRLRRFFAGQRKWTKLWSRPDRCMYEGCTEKSIPRSHSIPMSASLKLISEEGHVVTPRLGENGIYMDRIGIREASTFPGFCARHESIFAEFETQKQMSSERHYLLQTFRTLCREIFRMRRQKERLESALSEYRKLRRGFIIARIQKAHQSRSTEIRDITFENDEIESRAVHAITSLSGNLPILNGIYCDLFHDIQNGTHDSSIVVRNFNLRLPVCLSGLGELHYMQNGTTMHALCILAIIPEDQETKIILGAAKEHTNALASYCSDETSPNFLATMESWLCHGSDHWFMTPTEWHAIPESRQKVILARILAPDLTIAHPVDFSILDGPRMHIIKLIEQSLSSGDLPTASLPQIYQLLACETGKLDDITSRRPRVQLRKRLPEEPSTCKGRCKSRPR